MEFAPMRASMRPFGRAADLDLDFGQSDRPGLVTAVLAQCDAGDTAADAWWSRSVGARTAALLGLVTVTEDKPQISFTARCTQVGCGGLFGFDLPLQALAAQGMTDDEPVQVELDAARSVRLRRPTGADLRDWHAQRPATRAQAVQTMLNALLLDGRVDAHQYEARLSEAIAALDPLVAFSARCTGPACGAPSEVTV
ncbi:MAG: hypothetical protein ABIW85_08045, partial [Variovorax sp.]